LDPSDIVAAYEVLRDFDRQGNSYYAFFNCGYYAGASRVHKHIQVVPKPPTLFPDRKGYDTKAIPYLHFVSYLDNLNGEPVEVKLVAAYASLLAKARESVALPQDAEQCQHNMVMTLDWISIIPRRQVPSLEVSIPNSAGMMGSVWLPGPEKIGTWKQRGPLKILSECGVPNPDARPQ
jgi:ATP adenylyltransferase/5',5'''-P-1,P-4-tetraphosphate phosphorylase II